MQDWKFDISDSEGEVPGLIRLITFVYHSIT